ncbi:hypothetical protein ACHAQJ_010281 [Trichoderma viride]
MYNDPARAETREQRRIESMFGRMESQASAIFRRIVKSHEVGDTIVTLTRIERDLVRKFLFLLKYRGSKFHQRFYHEDSDSYCANDRELLLEYMRERGFPTPRDVWFHNLETIMNLNMDPDRKWTQELPRKMYSDDAAWFIMHVDYYYMAICTPFDAKDEFLLTDNCYNIFEGPNTFQRDEITGQVQGGSHAGFHEFAVISPQLIIVLRCLALPIPEEDVDPKVSQERHDTYWSSFANIYGSDVKSLLEDLPIKKCGNSYSETIAGAVLPNAGYDWKFRLDDKFYFKYHPIKSRHVRIINNIFLDNAYRSSMLAFRNPETFFHILETYISGPCDSNKMVGGDDADGQEQFLRRLEMLLRTMGSQKSLVWKRIHTPKDPFLQLLTNEQLEHRKTRVQRFTNKQLEYRRMIMRRFMNDDTYHDPMTTFVKLYSKLGKRKPYTYEEYISDETMDAYDLSSDTKSGFERDVAQAGKMVHFQSMVEAWSPKRNKAIHARNMRIISSMFTASYCSRYWLYLKLLRKSKLGDRDGAQDIVDLCVTPDIRQGPEDIFAQKKRRYEIESLWMKSPVDIRAIFHQVIANQIIFDRPGQIRKCGIQNIELLAKKEEKLLRKQSTCYDSFNLLHEDEDKHLELMVRVRVKSKFQAAMAGKAEDSILRELEDIFFRLTFPTPVIE